MDQNPVLHVVSSMPDYIRSRLVDAISGIFPEDFHFVDSENAAEYDFQALHCAFYNRFSVQVSSTLFLLVLSLLIKISGHWWKALL